MDFLIGTIGEDELFNNCPRWIEEMLDEGIVQDIVASQVVLKALSNIDHLLTFFF